MSGDAILEKELLDELLKQVQMHLAAGRTDKALQLVESLIKTNAAARERELVFLSLQAMADEHQTEEQDTKELGYPPPPSRN